MGLPGASPPPEWVRASWEAQPGPRGEKRGRVSRSLGREVWAGLGQLWYCGTAVGAGEGWMSEQTEGTTFSFLKLGGFGKPSKAQCLRAACCTFPPGCQNSRMAADNSGCQAQRTTDQTLPRSRPTGAQALARSPAKLAVPKCQAFPPEPRSWAVMAGGPGLLPVSFPASQALGQGWAAPCYHSFPATLWLSWAGPPGQADRRHAALLWPEYPAGQGSMPRSPGASLDSNPISGGQREAQAGISLGRDAPASPAPNPPQAPLHTPSPAWQTLDLLPLKRQERTKPPGLTPQGLPPLGLSRSVGGAPGGRRSETRRAPSKPLPRNSPGAVMGRGGCLAAPANFLLRRRVVPSHLAVYPTTAAQLPR